MTDLDVRAIDRSEFPGFYRCLSEVFGDDPRDADREVLGSVFEPERSTAVLDGGTVVATAGIYTREMTVPGGPRPVAGVTVVSVQPTHRRRGLLTEMMRRQLTGLHEEQREPVAALWASEGGIYGRFGYGIAARQARWQGSQTALRLRPDVPTGSGRVVLAPAEQARPHVTAVYEALRPTSVGWLERPGRWWDRAFNDPQDNRNGSTSRRYALHTEQDGSVTGVAAYRTKKNWTPERNDSEVQVADVFTLTPTAYAALWSYLAGIDLHPRLSRDKAPLDDPLPHLLADSRAYDAVGYDSLWVRLADVRRALAARAYRVPVDVVLEVRDAFCPWNAGRVRLSGDATGATCGPTTDPADLELSATQLGAAYLGGTTLASLAAAGLVTEVRPGALAAASLAFSTERSPWCPEVF